MAFVITNTNINGFLGVGDSFTAPYPTGYTKDNFEDSGLHSISIGGNNSFVRGTDFTIDFGQDLITITSVTIVQYSTIGVIVQLHLLADLIPGVVTTVGTGAMVDGVLVITHPLIGAKDHIFYSMVIAGGATGAITVTKVAGEFTMTSDEDTEDSTFDYFIMPAKNI